MDFFDILIDELDSKDKEVYILQEGIVPINPLLAYFSFKSKIFNKMRKAKAFLQKPAIKAKAAASMVKTGARAKLELPVGETIFKYTPEQLKVLNKIKKKYGKELISKIDNFRKTTLAQYANIKNIIKKSGRVSSKDITGLTPDEFRSALESGRKKIEARGGHFERMGGRHKKLTDYNDRVEALQTLKTDFQAGKKPNYNIANKVIKTFGVSKEDFENYSREDLSKVYSAIMRNKEELTGELKKLRKQRAKGEISPESFERSTELIKRSKRLWKGKGIDLTLAGGLQKGGSFDSALGKYFFSRDVWNQLTSGTDFNIFKQTYLTVIDRIISKTREKKEQEFGKLVKGKKEIEFNDKEEKIWKLRPGIKEKFSGNIKDYYQAITEKDFPEEAITIKRSPELKQAEQKIENAIRRFERSLGKMMTAEDLQKLKRFRMINNLISIKELRAPDKLFKTREEMEGEIGEMPKDDYLSRDEFVRRVREIATIEYDTMAELRRAKEEAERMASRMESQGDEEVVDDNESILRQIRMRRTPSAQKVVGQKYETTGLIDINDIEKMTSKMIKTDYTSVEKMKLDKQRLNKMIEKYKETDKDAERNLAEIDFLIKRLNRKFERGM